MAPQNYDARFAFGKNWQQFLEKHFSAERLEDARRRLLDLLGLPSLAGLSFLDIGSGSGLHSLAALKAGAGKVDSFDYDPQSVAATKMLKKYAGNPDNWTVEQGSVLDESFMNKLAKADIVYSWGVLHHTGAVWRALNNATIPLKPDGLLSIALYSETRYQDGSLNGHPTPEKWLKIKKEYNRHGWPGKQIMLLQHIYRSYFAWDAPNLCKGWRRLKQARAHYEENRRGMEFWTDLRDWLGGWPMEFVAERACMEFMRERGLMPLNLVTGEGNSEYLFTPCQAVNAWSEKLAKRQMLALSGPFAHEQGFMYSCDLPDGLNMEFVWEEDLPLGYHNAPRQSVSIFGKGRYFIENNKLFFAASDNSDPNGNGRLYGISSYA